MSDYYCAAITRAQFIGRNAVNFLLALGGYGLFFLLLGAFFFFSFLFRLPSLTSRRRVRQRSYRGERQKPRIRLLLFVSRPRGLCFLNWEFKGGREGKMLFKHLLKKTKAQHPYRWLWREMVAPLVVDISIISCHAAGRRALGASNACISAAVLGGGRVVGNRLSFCSRAGTSWRQEGRESKNVLRRQGLMKRQERRLKENPHQEDLRQSSSCLIQLGILN